MKGPPQNTRHFNLQGMSILLSEQGAAGFGRGSPVWWLRVPGSTLWAESAIYMVYGTQILLNLWNKNK